MGSFGERMQREREMRGITLEEIAESTKIGSRALRALEQEDFEKLPGGIFNKGFVRAYARYLGIDEEQAVTDFMAAEQAAQAKAEQALPQPLPPAKTATGIGPILFLVLGLAVIGGVAGWRYVSARRPKPTVETVAIPTAPSTAANNSQGAPTPAAQSQLTPAETASPPRGAEVGSPSSSGEPFTVEIRARQPAWISVVADGVVLMEGTLGADEQKQFQAKARIILKTGNAGGVELSYNGRPVPALGADRQARTFVFTRQGLEEPSGLSN